MKDLLALGVLTVAAGVWSLGSLGDAPLPELSNMTATAILGWYAWHTASRTIPELIESFRDELTAARAEGRDERNAFRHELTAERQQRHADHQAIVEALHELAGRDGK